MYAIQQFATDPRDRSRAEDLAAKFSQLDFGAAKAASTRYLQAQVRPQASPTQVEQQKVDNFAPVVVLRAAAAVLQNTTAATVSAAIQKLADTVIQKLPERVDLHIASEDQRSQAKVLQSKLTESGYISPGIHNVAKGYIPDTLEVRYFDEKSGSAAEHILEALKASGAKDGRVSYVIPTANDLRIYPSITSHFEVWAGKNSL